MEGTKKMEKDILVRNMFRRSSSTDHESKAYLVQASEIPTILNRMGQKVNEREVMTFIKMLDSEGSSYLDYNKFTKVCEKFLTNAAALEKFKGDEFSFKNLINLEDFANP